MDEGKREIAKRKAIEALGCALYMAAFLVMGSVLLSKCGKF